MPEAHFETGISVPADNLSGWHARPGAHHRLVPPWLPPDEHLDALRPGGQSVLSISLGFGAIEWISRIREVRSGSMLRGVQMHAPFREWEHRNLVLPDGKRASRLIDQISISYPGWMRHLRSLPDRIENEIERAFTYRHAVTKGDLEFLARYRIKRPLRIAVSGSSGMIGAALSAFLDAAGHRVLRLVRRTPQHDDEIYFDYREDALETKRLEGVDAVIHLGGFAMGSLRWSEEQRLSIYNSRVKSTLFLARALSRLRKKPEVFLTASSIGVYGERRDEPLDERSPRAESGFLPVLSRDWESAAGVAEEAGIRTVRLRFGLVTSPRSSILQFLVRPMKVGLGIRYRGRNADVSWISPDDTVRAIYHVLRTSDLSGPINVVSPEPTTRHELIRNLAEIHRTRTRLAATESAVRFILGDVATEAVFPSRLVLPSRLLATGFAFAYPKLDGALRHSFGKLPKS